MSQILKGNLPALHLPAVSGWVVSHPFDWNEDRPLPIPILNVNLSLSLQLLFCSPGGTEGIQESLGEHQEKQ